MQDRLDLVLQPRALADDVRAPRDLPPARLRGLVGDPHRGQVVAGQQLREDRRVDLVGLDLGLGDRPGLLRVADHDPRDLPRSARTIAWVLPVASNATSSLGARLSAKTFSASAVSAICPAWRTTPSCQIATCAKSRCTSKPKHRLVTALTSHSIWTVEAAGGQDDTYGSALAAHPGKSQGPPSTNTGSKPIERDRPARPRLPQGRPCPGRSHRTHHPGRIGVRSSRWERRQRLRRFIPDTNLLERSLGEDRPPRPPSAGREVVLARRRADPVAPRSVPTTASRPA